MKKFYEIQFYKSISINAAKYYKISIQFIKNFIKDKTNRFIKNINIWTLYIRYNYSKISFITIWYKSIYIWQYYKTLEYTPIFVSICRNNSDFVHMLVTFTTILRLYKLACIMFIFHDSFMHINICKFKFIVTDKFDTIKSINLIVVLLMKDSEFNLYNIYILNSVFHLSWLFSTCDLS